MYCVNNAIILSRLRLWNINIAVIVLVSGSMEWVGIYQWYETHDPVMGEPLYSPCNGGAPLFPPTGIYVDTPGPVLRTLLKLYRSC